jgi:hypothetical protein
MHRTQPLLICSCLVDQKMYLSTHRGGILLGHRIPHPNSGMLEGEDPCSNPSNKHIIERT